MEGGRKSERVPLSFLLLIRLYARSLMRAAALLWRSKLMIDVAAGTAGTAAHAVRHDDAAEAPPHHAEVHPLPVVGADEVVWEVLRPFDELRVLRRRGEEGKRGHELRNGGDDWKKRMTRRLAACGDARALLPPLYCSGVLPQLCSVDCKQMLWRLMKDSMTSETAVLYRGASGGEGSSTLTRTKPKSGSVTHGAIGLPAGGGDAAGGGELGEAVGDCC